MTPADASAIPVWAYVFKLVIPGGGPDIVKVGRSACPWLRVTNIKRQTPFDVTVLGVIDDGVAVENDLKERLAFSNIRGEWFRDTATLRSILSLYENDGRLYQMRYAGRLHYELVVKPLLEKCADDLPGADPNGKRMRDMARSSGMHALPLGGPHDEHFKIVELSGGRIPLNVTMGILPSAWDGNALTLLRGASPLVAAA